MQMSCSVINLKSVGSSLVLNGFSEYYLQPPIFNRIYTSASNYLSVAAKVGKEDWFQCQWTSWNRPTSATDFKFCQQGTTKEVNGTICPLDNLINGQIPKKCSFHIFSLNYDYGNYTDQRAQFSCSHVNLTSAGSYLKVTNSLEMGYVDVPVVNRIYVSDIAMYQQYMISLYSLFTIGDQFECKWDPYVPPTTNDFKSCRDSSATTANGTLQPFTDYDTKIPRWRDFTIQVSTDNSVQFSCSVVNLTTSGSSLQLRDWNGALITEPPITNQGYISKNFMMVVSARFFYPDWFNCQWKTVPVPLVKEPQQPIFQMCNNDHETRSVNGTLQPFKAYATGLHTVGCRFYIYVPVDQRVQMTCSVVRMHPGFFGDASFINFYEMDGTVISMQPLENEVTHPSATFCMCGHFSASQTGSSAAGQQ
ncbi:uncharacterized protein LOC124342305 isoform X2 [Daphnia pulicaria]|uniref:uncharacterized protein LOC124342305 isoform X2 n=1 Tax=Daphnia pulicaria TaxID=35523 RepID=UPI001EEB57C3|nr:uncharacterized protein LOC124342305 isoform X2 [Daphnia pulicaria]